MINMRLTITAMMLAGKRGIVSQMNYVTDGDTPKSRSIMKLFTT